MSGSASFHNVQEVLIRRALLDVASGGRKTMCQQQMNNRAEQETLDTTTVIHHFLELVGRSSGLIQTEVRQAAQIVEVCQVRRVRQLGVAR